MTPPADEPAPVTPGWSVPRFVDLPGYPDDMVAGVVLAAPSTCSTGDRVTVAHPQHPSQRHRLAVWQGRDVEGRSVTFAFGEVSNTAFLYSVRLTS